jgi:2-polyprenyl-3-methyl-5-hydroxy-6-metoxy-1,4-benzoquinol methylase
VGRYEAEIDLTNPNLSHTQVVDLVGVDKRVLDVGCADGDVARALNRRGCKVSGIDVDPASAERAREDLEQLVIADLNTSRLSDHFGGQTFDAIVFADVLEHLLDPEAVLRDSLSLLSADGHVVVSIPNIAHGGVRLSLLTGQWNYTDTGLLDRTHLRFFTRDSFLALFETCDLVVTRLQSTVADPLSVEVRVDGDSLAPEVIDWVRHQPDALNYQFVAAARPRRPGDADLPVPELVPAIPDVVVRAEDRYTQSLREKEREDAERHRELLDGRHRLLTVRDHIIGLEAATATARSGEERALQQLRRTEARLVANKKRLAQARRRRARAERRLRKLRAQLRRSRRASRQEIESLKHSRTWRAGEMVTSPLRMFRRSGKAAR